MAVPYGANIVLCLWDLEHIKHVKKDILSNRYVLLEDRCKRYSEWLKKKFSEKFKNNEN